jgi:hypothetical protein
MVIYNELDAFDDGEPWRLVAAALEEDLCTMSNWTACPSACPSFAIEGRSMAILAASR